jgi:signal transduction histidine kinase
MRGGAADAPATAGNRTGSGVGLQVVQAIARAHGGSAVEVHESPGTCIELRLPARG